MLPAHGYPLLREHPNLYADMSGHVVVNVLNRDRKYAREFIIRNSDKLLFGTDICIAGQRSPLADFLVEENEGESLVLRWEIIEPLEVGQGGIIRFQCRVR